MIFCEWSHSLITACYYTPITHIITLPNYSMHLISLGRMTHGYTGLWTHSYSDLISMGRMTHESVMDSTCVRKVTRLTYCSCAEYEQKHYYNSTITLESYQIMQSIMYHTSQLPTLKMLNCAS